MDFLRRLFGGGGSSSAKEAKERLRLVLIHDRTDISPQLLENLRLDMIAVLTRYMDIDENKIEIDLDHGLDNDGRSVALVANIPVLRVKRGAVIGTVENSIGENKAFPHTCPHCGQALKENNGGENKIISRGEFPRGGNMRGKRHR